jgi:pSer/pThr/pTyr-binding forkhead associated (FHA) protein
LSNSALYPSTGIDAMNNKIEHKLVVVSGTSNGHEFPLSMGRTTIGSATSNDVLLADQNVSGFHAEVRIENDAWYISDFNSEKGTFLNGKRVTNETQLTAGDRIRIGSTNTVFIPLNAILVKKNIGIKDSTSVSKTSVFRKHKKRFLALSAIVLVLCAIKMVPTSDRERNAENGQVANSSLSLPQATAASVEKHVSSSNVAGNNKTGAKNEGTVGANGEQDPSHKKSGPHDKIADVNLKIAEKFSAYQLWNEALEHYKRVSEKSSDHPVLSEQIAKMQFEIGNKAAFRQGIALIKLGRYEKGISILKNIPEKSYYFPEAAQEIDKANIQMTNALKRKHLK